MAFEPVPAIGAGGGFHWPGPLVSSVPATRKPVERSGDQHRPGAVVSSRSRVRRAWQVTRAGIEKRRSRSRFGSPLGRMVGECE